MRNLWNIFYNDEIHDATKSWPQDNQRPTRWMKSISIDQRPIKQGFKNLWLKSPLCCDHDFNNPISSHTCICSGRSTVMTRDECELWSGLIIIFQVGETWFLQNIKCDFNKHLKNASWTYQSIPMLLGLLSRVLRLLTGTLYAVS